MGNPRSRRAEDFVLHLPETKESAYELAEIALRSPAIRAMLKAAMPVEVHERISHKKKILHMGPIG